MEKSGVGMKRFSGSIPASAIKNFLWGLADPRKSSNVLSSISTVNGFLYMVHGFPIIVFDSSSSASLDACR